METKQHWRILVKGYHHQMFKDSSIGRHSDGISYQDTTYGYGYIFFYGTKDQLGEREMDLFRAGCKILGSELWQPDTSTAELKKRVKALYDRALKRFLDLCDVNDDLHPEIGWHGRTFNGSRNYTKEEERLLEISKRIWKYYIKKYVSPYL